MEFGDEPRQPPSIHCDQIDHKFRLFYYLGWPYIYFSKEEGSLTLILTKTAQNIHLSLADEVFARPELHKLHPW